MPRIKRSGKRPAQGSRAADRDDDQEIDHELDRESGVEVEDLDAERAGETGKAGPDSEGDREQAVDIDAHAARHAGVVDRGAQLAAKARARQHDVKEQRDQPADDDQKQPVDADVEPREDVKLPAEEGAGAG